MKIIISKSLQAQSYINDNSPLNYQDKRFSPPEEKPEFKEMTVDLSFGNKNGELFSNPEFENGIKNILISYGQDNVDQFYALKRLGIK